MSDKLINYKASPTAQKFHASKAFVRGIMGPFGCIGHNTEVMTGVGLKPISRITAQDRVLSWCDNRGRYVLSPTTGGFPKGRDYLYRVVTTQGEFDAAGHHRLLCADGSYQRVDTLARGQSVSLCSEDPRQTSSSMFLRSLPLDEPHYSQTVLDSLAHYGLLARQYGQQLLGVLDTAPASSPSLDDALVSSQFVERMGGFLGQERGRNHRDQYASHQPSRGFSRPSERLEANEGNCGSSLPFSRILGLAQQYWRSLQKTSFRLLKKLSASYYYLLSNSISKGAILSVTRKSYKEEYWDLQVADTNNYITADGTIHHNSGKSVAMCWEIFMKAKNQAPGPDGIRRTRWIVARNTQPQLETTTIKTWLDWFPEEIFGKMSRKPPFTHNLKLGDIEMEVIFLALDKPEDVKKLLSFEVTGVFFNEAREMEYEVIAGATGRVGRYPSSKDGVGCTWSGIIMDTNPPTDDHWWYKMAEEQAWAVDKFGNPVDVEEIDEEDRWAFWKQPSGLAPDGENLENLMQPKGWEDMTLAARRKAGRKYYERQLGGKTEEWINVYVHGNYGFIKHGMPVYKGAWNPDIHTSKETISIPAGGIIYVGVDASGRHPAAVFLFRTMGGQIQVLHELCVVGDEGMGATAFARLLKQEMSIKFPAHDFAVFGDPAGAWASQNDERTYFDILRAQGIFIKPSPGLRIPERIETVIDVLSRNVQGGPAMVVSPVCKQLLRGMNGGYRYKRLSTGGDARYDEKPEKNRYSDVQDALQYVLCGMGEMRKMYGRGNAGSKKTVFANTRFSI